MLGGLVCRRPQPGVRLVATFLGFLALGIWLYAGYAAQFAYFIAFLMAALLIERARKPGGFSGLLTAAWVAVGLFNLAPDVASACLQRSETGADFFAIAFAGRGPRPATPSCR